MVTKVELERVRAKLLDLLERLDFGEATASVEHAVENLDTALEELVPEDNES